MNFCPAAQMSFENHRSQIISVEQEIANAASDKGFDDTRQCSNGCKIFEVVHLFVRR